MICTQPRRLAAAAIAARIAEERVEKLGGIVGYQVKYIILFITKRKLFMFKLFPNFRFGWRAPSLAQLVFSFALPEYC